MTNHTFNLAVLVSGTGSNFQAIQQHIETGKIDARIVVLISNKANAGAIDIAKQYGIEYKVIEAQRDESRETYDQRLQAELEQYPIDLIVLAGFMRILSKAFVEHYAGKLINIHPSLLPRYKGLNTHQRAIDNGDKEHGASVHWVINELDAGDVILQGKVPVLENDTAETLQQRVHKIEHEIYPRVIGMIVNGEV